MAEYHVAYMVVYSEVVEAESPEEATKKAAYNCPYDIDGAFPAHVTRVDTDEEWDV